jgi:hypothetical protein
MFEFTMSNSDAPLYATARTRADVGEAISEFAHETVMPGLDPGIWCRWREIAGSSPAMTV